MTAQTPARRALETATDPWVLLVAALGGGLAWAVGIPILVALCIAVAMLGGAAAFGAARGPRQSALDGPRLRHGTEQARLVAALDGYLGDLRQLRTTKLPDAVTDPAIEALVAADGARQVALRVAAAVDALDLAIGRSAKVYRTTPSETVRASWERMAQRRQALIERLTGAVEEVAEVYTKLLELSATVDTIALGDDAGGVESVNASLDGLRTAFAELETEASAARGELT